MSVTSIGYNRHEKIIKLSTGEEVVTAMMDVLTIKLSTGEEVVARFDSVTEDFIIVNRVHTATINPQTGAIQLEPKIKHKSKADYLQNYKSMKADYFKGIQNKYNSLVKIKLSQIVAIANPNKHASALHNMEEMILY